MFENPIVTWLLSFFHFLANRFTIFCDIVFYKMFHTERIFSVKFLLKIIKGKIKPNPFGKLYLKPTVSNAARFQYSVTFIITQKKTACYKPPCG